MGAQREVVVLVCAKRVRLKTTTKLSLSLCVRQNSSIRRNSVRSAVFALSPSALSGARPRDVEWPRSRRGRLTRGETGRAGRRAACRRMRRAMSLEVAPAGQAMRSDAQRRIEDRACAVVAYFPERRFSWRTDTAPSERLRCSVTGRPPPGQTGDTFTGA
jgi:hypothetical protein